MAIVFERTYLSSLVVLLVKEIVGIWLDDIFSSFITLETISTNSSDARSEGKQISSHFIVRKAYERKYAYVSRFVWLKTDLTFLFYPLKAIKFSHGAQ